MKRDGTRRRTGGEVKGKLPNGVGSQYPSRHLCNMVYPTLLPLLLLMRTFRLPVVDWTDAPDDLNGLVRFAERQNLVSARVPSHFKRNLPFTMAVHSLYHLAQILSQIKILNHKWLLGLIVNYETLNCKVYEVLF